ncbi:hypothetical protein [Pyrobaculum ferrireducens]|uniref:Uncharacterized protein n=1 Tax=Pyrobaculum ferrireducens TaxID=1104324 RepID=G7VC65_9CREN|nr:hypothetical protein [Pyrobaculum ferrireducens]AET33751.1 hypothetical protein P186_2363 [Pyrobaculum ferrireducens]
MLRLRYASDMEVGKRYLRRLLGLGVELLLGNLLMLWLLASCRRGLGLRGWEGGWCLRLCRMPRPGCGSWLWRSWRMSSSAGWPPAFLRVWIGNITVIHISWLLWGVMRYVLLVSLLVVLAFAYVVPTESLDVYYWAKPDGVYVVGLDGATLWSANAVFPLVASDSAGRCFAVVNRPYVYDIGGEGLNLRISVPTTVELSEDLLATFRQYGISLPPRVPIVLNITIPLPPVIIAATYKTAVASLHAPYGYPLWAVTLGPRANATAAATDCQYVVVGTIGGEVYVLANGRVVDVKSLGEPVTSAAWGRAPGVFYIGTAGGRIFRYSQGSLAQVGTCSGQVYSLAATPDGSAVAACFKKGERPEVELYPYGLRLAPSVLAEYGIDSPRVPAALSQDGRVFAVGVQDYVVVFEGGRESWRAKVPSLPLAVAVSGNGSVVAVGTLGGDVLVFWRGREVARLGGSSPVTSLGLSVDGRALVVERWTQASATRLAFVNIALKVPGQCLPADVDVRVGDSTYLYRLAGSGTVFIPVGRVSLAPRYKYMGDVRCRPLGNVTLDVRGDVEAPVELGYVLEYRVSLMPPNITRGPGWASGPASFFAERVVQIPVVDSPVQQGRLVLVGWEVDGKRLNLSAPSVSVDVSRPTEVKALYRVELPGYVQVNATYRLRLESVFVFDRFGTPIASGPAPVVSVYPVIVRGVYTPQVLVSTVFPAVVNGSTSLWADLGSVVVFQGRDVEFRNGTRLAFVKWVELDSSERTVQLVADRAVRLTPQYEVQYRVWAKLPATVVEPVNATWVARGSAVKIAVPDVLSQQGNTRTVVGQWVINGVPNATLKGNVITLRVTKPLNVTYTVKRQYLLTFTTRYGSVTPAMWVDEGGTAAVVPTPMDVWAPPPLRWVFAGWRDTATGVVYSYPQMPVAYGPVTYEAVWTLDLVPILAIAGAAAGAVFLVWFRRRRRLARLMAEVQE